MKNILYHCFILMDIDSPAIQDAAKAIRALDTEKSKKMDAVLRSFERLEKKSKKNVAALRVLRTSNANLHRQVVRKDAKIEKLQEKLKMMTKQAFGSKSDSLSHQPAPTADEEAAIEQKLQAEADKAKRSKDSTAQSPAKDEKPPKTKEPKESKGKGKGRQRRKYGEDFEIENVPHGPDTCPCGCGGTKRLGKPIEEFITIPARHVLLRHEWPVYRCRSSGKLRSHNRDKKLFPGKSLGGSTIAYFVALKFDWFMPTYRQERIMKQEGAFVHRSTISRCINMLADRVLAPIAGEIYKELVDNSDVVHSDETSHFLLVNGNGKVKKRSLLSIVRDERGWGGLRFPAAFYRMFPSNSQAAFEELFADKTLTVIHDGHAAFNRFGVPDTRLEGIESSGCWAHGRRYFVDAHNITNSKDAGEVVRLIDRLFGIERQLRGHSPRFRKRARGRDSRPILQKIFHRLAAITGDYPRDTYMGRAIRYTLRRRGQLTKFLEDGRIEISNNAVERAFKSPILLRNASMFSASAQGEQAWAVCFTLSETCRLNGVNFYRYLLWVMDEVVRMGDKIDYRILLPWNAPDNCFTAVTDGK